MTDIIERPKVEKRTEPAKRWKNKFRAKRAFRERRGQEFSKGDFCTDPRTWPSKETAEQCAAEMLCDPNVQRAMEYLGAFPEGAAP